MNIAIIKAGGVGSRMGADIPKQFICVQEKPIIIYTIEAFERHPSVDAVIAVCLSGWHDVLRSYLNKYGIKKVVKIIDGGETSLKSIKKGVDCAKKLYSQDDIILIHDGNRPLISADIISDVIAKCNLFNSAVAAIPCTDEMMKTDGIHMESKEFINRKTLFRIQTPDAYKLSLATRLFENVTEDQLQNLGATNTLMISMGEKVHFAKGSETNIRLTTQEDIALCESLITLRNRNN